MIRRGLFFILLFSLTVPAWAVSLGFYDRQDGGQPGAFLESASSARPIAMGGAWTAVANDASAPFWNVSGLAQIQRYDLVTSFARLGEDASIGAGGLALPTARLGTFGLNIVGLRSGSYQRRDQANRDLGGFDSDATAYLISHGLNVGTRWSAGYTVKAIRQSVAQYSDTGYGVDFGLMARPHALWQTGFAIQNVIRPSLQLKDETERYPRQMTVGGKFDASKKVTIAGDIAWLEKTNPELKLGLEWRPADPLALRVGANDRELAAGLGVSVGDAAFDYAFGFLQTDAVRDSLGGQHRITMRLAFGTNVMAGSYKDLARRREIQRQEIALKKEGKDNIKPLIYGMEKWDLKMNESVFASVQEARGSLRELAFSDPFRALEAQAYISQFQGRFSESARLFQRLEELKPRDGRIRRHSKLAQARASELSKQGQVAAVYDRMDAQHRRRQAAEAKALASRPAPPAAALPAGRQEAGGAGFAMAPPIRGAGALPPVTRPAVKPVPPPPAPVQKPVRKAAPLPPPPVPAPASKEVVPPAPPSRPASAPPKPSAAPVPPKPEAPAVRKEIVEAREHHENGDYVKSHIVTRKLLEANPSDREAARQSILTSAVVTAEAEIVDPKATVDHERIARRVDQSMDLFEKGQKLYEKRRREEALTVWQQALDLCPANFLARDSISRVSQQIENEEFERMLRAEGRRR